MKRILIITLEFPPQIGGVQNYVAQFASALPIEDVVVLAPKHAQAKEFDQRYKFKLIRKNPYLPIFLWPRWLRLVWQVWRIIKEEKIEIIHLHHSLPVGYVAWIMNKLKKIPYLVFSHGTDIIAGTASFWKRKMLKIVANGSQQVVFNSESLKRRLLRILPELASKSIVLYPCPEQKFFEPPKQEIVDKLKSQYALEGKKVILSVSRLADGKGFPHLIRIMPKILQKIPNLIWLIVGDGPKKDLIRGLIQKNNLQSIVRFVGEIPHDDLREFFDLADLFVLLTHPDEGKEEGLGLVFLEAAASGLAAVAGRSGGVEEAVLHTKTGIIVDIYKGDQAVINSIVDLLQNDEFRETLGKNAQNRIRLDFQWSNQLKVLKRWL